MTVLIVGGAGYIGAHVNKLLHSKGCATVVLDNLSRGHREFVKWGDFYEGDCRDTTVLDRIFQEHQIDVVMHFAAFAYVGESVSDPLKYYENNVASTLRLLDAMVKNGVRRLVFSSTCATFGVAQYLPIDELHPQVPINPYGRSKLMIEQVLKDVERSYGLKSCVFRYFNAAGNDPEGDILEDHDPETHVIPLLLRAFKNPGNVFEVYGTKHDTKDGTCVRDYIHVQDLAEAHWLGAEKLMETNESMSFNLGNGRGFSVQELIAAAERVTGREARIVYKEAREGDPATLVGCSDRAKRFLGWTPKITDIEDILKTVWRTMSS